MEQQALQELNTGFSLLTTNLEGLSLHLKDTFMEPLVANFSKYSRLKSLSLACVNLNKCDQLLFPSPNLKELKLPSCTITDAGAVAHLCNTISVLTNLLHLDLTCNHIDTTWLPLLTIPTSLRHLTIDNTDMQGFEHISKQLFLLTSLRSLNISSCSHRFGTVEMIMLTKSLPNLSYLTSLSLEYNCVEDESVEVLVKSLAKLTNLDKLNLSHNRINSLGASYIAQLLHALNNITYLSVVGNPIGPEGIQELRDAKKKRMVLLV